MKYPFLAGLICAATVCAAQQSKPDLIKVGTVSPDAASLGKFGNIPVNYSTGIPSINIPIYEIKIGKTKVPISINYHAGGIRVDEVASSVGLGWALDCGGTISRNVMGLADEAGSTGYLYAPNFAAVQSQPESYRQFITDVVDGTRDVLQDQFSYSLPGQSGKFVFNQDASIFQVPLSNNKIERYYNSNGFCFKITDDKGTVYLFERSEEYRPGSVMNQQPNPYINVWHLTQIIDPNTEDIITFNYQLTCGNMSFETIANGTYKLGTQATCDRLGSGQPGIDDVDGYSETHQHNTFTPYYLSDITWRGGKIVFTNVCDRSDRSSEMRISEITFYSDDKNVLTQVKKVKFYHSYFTSTQGTPYNLLNSTVIQEAKYRLRLDSLAFISVNVNDQPQKYKMEYDNTEMAARETYSQDVWGFNNGKWTNTSLMAKQLVNGWTNSSGIYNPSYREIGTANRDVDENYMKAATLKTLQYPTGGKTTFELEPHQYTTNQEVVNINSVTSSAYGTINEQQTVTFTVQSNWENIRASGYFSSFNYPGVFDRPRGKIYDITDINNPILVSNYTSNTDPNQDVTYGMTPLYLTAGHTYKIFVEIYTTTAASVSAWVKVTYDERTTATLIKKGGGLRVKTIKNYDITGTLINQETYSYGPTEDGIGVLSIPYTFFSMNEETTKSRANCPDFFYGIWCRYYYGYDTRVFHASSLYPASQVAGSPVLYTSVTKYQLDFSGGKNNGKSVYEYKVYQDVQGVPGPDIDKANMRMISNSWRNGVLDKESIYKSTTSGGFTLKEVKQYNYSLSRATSQNCLQIKATYVDANERCEPLSTLAGEVYLSLFALESGVDLLQSTSNTSYDDNGNMLSTTENYVYGDATHLFPTSRVTTNSKGQTATTNMQYPRNFSASGNVYEKMVTRNIISPAVTTQQQLNGVQKSLETISFNDWFGNSKLVEPNKIDLQILAKPAETRVRFNSFDKYGNILQQQKENDVFQSYIWDYQSVYPVAQCMNADYNSIAYTSFEADGSGNWTIGSTSRTVGGITGKNCYQLSNGNISKPGLSAGTTYIVSYWTTNSSPFTITGTQGTVLPGRKLGNWTHFEHKVSGITSVTLQATGLIDELRLYPAGAQMTTNTFAPLTGITSSCSANNTIIYYEYDGMGRLKIVKDQDGNVIKAYEYHYKD